MKRLYEIIKKYKLQYDIDIKFVVGFENGDFVVCDVTNARMKNYRGQANGVGHFTIEENEEDSVLDAKMSSLVNAIDYDFKESLSDEGNIDRSSIGCIDNSIDTLKINGFGSVPIIEKDHDGYKFDKESGRMLEKYVKKK